jgi:hypothetical protein
VATVAVVGLGDLGTRVFDALARLPAIERLIGTSRTERRAAARVAQAALIAELSGGPRLVELAAVDVSDTDEIAVFLDAVNPDVIVLAASRHTWWRDRHDEDLSRLPYGVWLPLQASLAKKLMRAHADAGSTAAVVCLPFPDAVGPLLAPLGLAPTTGAGNVAEVASKLQLLAAREQRTERENVTVRLVMHHAVERFAFQSLSFLGGVAAHDGDKPPWRGEITVSGERLDEAVVSRLLTTGYEIPPDNGSHELTAACTARVVEALLADEPQLLHVPAPGGLPGGYPVRIVGRRLHLDLPAGLDVREAAELNCRASKWDGIESIESDGSLLFTAEVAEESERVLGIRLERVALTEAEAVADELAARLEERRGRLGAL